METSPALGLNAPPTISSPTVFSLQTATPKVDGTSGALTQSIPLDIPPGRGGLQPNLSINYNNQKTDNSSIVGYGWTLSIPYVARLNKTGSENLYGSNAYFTSSIDGELIAPSIPNAVSVLVVGGGGGGGSSGSGVVPAGGGGGGGGVLASSTYIVSPQTYTVTVGSGGSVAGDGGSSTFGSLTAVGGGAGGSYNSNGSSGGSGGGGGCFGSGGGGTSGQGNSGGNGGNGPNCGGAGGGGSQTGGSSSSYPGSAGGNGGNGTYSAISGVGENYGGGGGGGSSSNTGTPGTGGQGGGGSGGAYSNASNGVAFSGGGGGGTNAGYTAGSGGSGIVIISYPTSAASDYTCGGTTSTSGSNTVCTYTSSGSFTVGNSATVTTLSNNLVSYWKLDGNSNDATSSYNGSDSSITYSTANGKINEGAGFNGSSSYIFMGMSAVLSPTSGDYSTSAWIKLSSTGVGQIISGKPDQVQFSVTSSNKVKFLIEDSSRNTFSAIGSTTLAANTWYFVSAVLTSGTSLKVYVNGVLDGSNTTSIPTSYFADSSVNWALGAVDNHPTAAYFNGAIDEVGVWNRALSDSEITALYNSGTGLGYPFATSTSATSTATTGAYLPRIDNGSFDQYTFSTSTNSWTMHDKQGNEYLFGASAQSQQSATTSTSTVYKWMLEKEIDPNGNYIRYTYSKDGNQIYPDQIFYTGHNSTDGPMTITFATSSRPDMVTSFASGFEVNTDYRISQITAAVNGSTVRQYNLSYVTGNNGYRSLLSSIQENGWNESASETSLPAMTFGYVSTSTPFVTQNGIDGPAYVVADSNGDGINDANIFYTDDYNGAKDGIIDQDGTGSDSYPSVPGVWSNGPNNSVTQYLPNENGVRYVDVNGDGKADVVEGIHNYTSGIDTDAIYRNGYATSTGYGWSATSTWNGVIPQFWVTGSGSLNQSTGILGDVNGDGLPDFEQSADSGAGASNGSYLGNGSAWDAATTTIFSPVKSAPDNLGSSNYDSRLVDINGDGLDDWEWTDGANIYFDLNTGTGWGTPDANYTIATSSIQDVSGTYFDRGVRFIDINGDGLPDYIHSYSVSYNSCSGACPEQATYSTVMLNTGSGWATSTAYTFSDHVINAGYVSGSNEQFEALTNDELVNFNGNGQQDQDVLSTITYPKGGSTDVAYSYTTKSGVNPQLPYNLLVATKLVNHDGEGSNEETDYSYSGGRQYLSSFVPDRKFAGFASTTKTTSQATVVTYYSQGSTSTAAVAGDQSDGYGQLNHPYRQDTFTPLGTLVQKIFYQYDPIFHGGSEFVGLTRQLEQDYASDGTHQDKDTDYVYSTTTDDLIETQNYGQVTGNSDGTFSTSSATTLRTTLVSYAASSSINLSVPIEKTLLNSSGATTTDAKFYYDGLPFGSVDIGNATEEQDWATSTTYASSTKTYNAYGLVATSTDRDGNATAYSYDSFNMYPATVTNALGQSTTYTYNYSNGKVATTTDPNDAITKHWYDGVGRLTETDESDSSNPTSLIPKTEFQYIDSTTTPSLAHESNYLTAATTTDTYDYFDGLSRLIQERRSTENSGTFSVTDKIYNSVGTLASSSLPYFSSGSSRTSATTTSSLYTNYSYDPLGRVTTAVNSIGTTTSTYVKWTTTTTDPDGYVKDHIFDAFGNLAQVVEHEPPSNATTTYTYDAANNLTNITDAEGNIRNFTYDGLGDLLTSQDLHAATDTSFGSWSYSYDGQGNEISRTDPDGHTITHTYDALNRMSTETLTGSGTQVSNTYDSCTNGIGRLCDASSTDAQISYSYDVLGRTANATSTINGTSYPIAYSYDRQGNVTSITNADNSQIAYTYNSAGLPSKVSRSSGATSTIATLFNYAPTDQIGQLVFGSGASTAYSYDPAALYRLSRILTLGAPTSTNTTSQISVLVVGGGGQGGCNGQGGGGGGGGVIASSSVTIVSGSYVITVGSGGSGVCAGPAGSTGGSSSFGSLIMSQGGGGGGVDASGHGESGTDGGSGGGGGCGAYSSGSGGSGTTGEGSSGGSGSSSLGNACPGGGGGGAGGTGGNATATVAGSGGIGTASSITGSSVTYGCGGGGQGGPGNTGGSAGCSGSGAGVATGTGGSGATNLGGGGGGGDTGGTGGSGVVIIRYPTSQASDYTCGGTTATSSSDTICTFDSSGTFTVTESGTSTRSSLLQDLNYTYDANGNILSRLDNSDLAGGQTTGYEYDSLNRLVSASASGGNYPAYVQSFAYDPLGNLTQLTDSTSTGTSIAFDNAVQVGSGSGTSVTESYTTGTSTDRLMIVAVVSNSNGSTSLVSSITYNGVNLTKLSSAAFNTVSSPTNVFDVWYLINPPSGTHNLTINYSSSMGFGFDIATYSGASQVSFPDTWTSGGQDTGTTFSLTRCSSPSCATGAWTTLAALSQRNVSAGSNVTSRAGSGTGLYFGDSNGTVSGSDTMTVNISQSTATGGLMASIAPAGLGATSTVYSYAQTGDDNPDAVTQIADGSATTTFGYDDNGNLLWKTVGATTTNYAYDYLNRLIGSRTTGASATTTYGYDYAGNRVFQTTGSTTTVYPNPYESIVSTTVGSTTYATSTDYVLVPQKTGQSQLVAEIFQKLINGTATGTATTYYVHTDNLGSINAMSDASGTLVFDQDYYPYGATRVSTASSTYLLSSKGYIGNYLDPSNLIYDNARYYNPNQGQFTSEDPVFLNLGSQKAEQLANRSLQAILSDPQDLNAYSYSEDNPVTVKDPSGLITNNTATVLGLYAQVINLLSQIVVQLGGGGSAGNPRPASTAMFAYSTTINPAPLTITSSNQGNYGNIINQIQGSNEFNSYVQEQIKKNAQNGTINTPSNSAHSLDFSSGDLYTSLHAANAGLSGTESSNGTWNLHVTVTDTYNFSGVTNYGSSPSAVGITTLNNTAYLAQQAGIVSDYPVSINFDYTYNPSQ